VLAATTASATFSASADLLDKARAVAASVLSVAAASESALHAVLISAGVLALLVTLHLASVDAEVFAFDAAVVEAFLSLDAFALAAV
jgi:hypothetical protein